MVGKSFAEYLTEIEFSAVNSQVAYKIMCIAQMVSVHYDSSFQYQVSIIVSTKKCYYNFFVVNWAEKRNLFRYC